ncbi:MAG: PAS domain-containing sensor histidine kinase [Gemmatimonadaceae bacterium]|nr:PAS domain-containing sensor histidine kinase [Gloeobacterales cyanobacterium ES-bin-141]
MRQRESNGRFGRNYSESKRHRTLRLTDTAWKTLVQLAEQHHLSVSDLLEECVRGRLDSLAGLSEVTGQTEQVGEAHDVEARVQERTAQLKLTNECLQRELANTKNLAEEHRRVEQALRASEARFRRLAEANSIGVIFANLSGDITEANDAFLKMVGYSREDLYLGKVRWEDMTPPEYGHLDAFARSELRQFGVDTPFEKEYIRKDGSRVPILLGSALLEGSLHEAVCFVLDLTERKQAEEHRLTLERTRQLEVQMDELQKLDRLKDEFLSTVSHELRTPMVNLKLAVHLLEHATCQEKRELYLQILKKESSREIDLIDNLLDLQRLEAGARFLQSETITLKTWLPALVEPFYSRAQLHRQTFTVEVSPTLDTLTTDRIGLERVIAELVNNACKYTPPGETIEVRAKFADSCSHIELSVCNSGVQIEAEELTRIFEKFYRIASTNPWEQAGTGLGLALVKKLVEQLNGTIRVRSEAGRTTFTVELPSAPPL